MQKLTPFANKKKKVYYISFFFCYNLGGHNVALHALDMIFLKNPGCNHLEKNI